MIIRKQISELEFQRDQSQRTNHHALQEINSLKSTIEQLHEREQIQQREQNHRSSQIATVDNQLHDMKNQLRANEHRLDLLQKENEALKSSLEQLSLSHHEEPRNQSVFQITEAVRPRQQTPLWLLNTEIIEQQQQQQQQQAFTDPRPVTSASYIPRFSENDYAANGWIRTDPDVVPLQARPPTRAHIAQTIPPAAQNEMVLG